jgi:hypothetical protein
VVSSTDATRCTPSASAARRSAPFRCAALARPGTLASVSRMHSRHTCNASAAARPTIDEAPFPRSDRSALRAADAPSGRWLTLCGLFCLVRAIRPARSAPHITFLTQLCNASVTCTSSAQATLNRRRANGHPSVVWLPLRALRASHREWHVIARCDPAPRAHCASDQSD